MLKDPLEAWVIPVKNYPCSGFRANLLRSFIFQFKTLFGEHCYMIINFTHTHVLKASTIF